MRAEKIDKVYIGYDASEHKAYQVAKYTAQKYTFVPVEPIVQDWLRAYDLYTRPRDMQASNDFSLTRFLTPYLSRFRGVALFTDCDMLFTQNLNNMLRGIESFYSKVCYVVKHNYIPKTSSKMDGRVQYAYPMKNWSSVVLWNCEHPLVRKLTPDFINKAQPADLHQFKWIDHDFIGELSINWNFLVGEYDAPDEEASFLTEPTVHTPAVLHYTLGVPSVHDELYTKDYAQLFEATYNEFLQTRFENTTKHSDR